MILRRLRLRHFRKYRDAEIVFPEGLVGIVGPNGTGKSTLFEAAAWALFGNPLSRTGGFGLVTTGTRGPCEVDLAFEHDDRAYRVLRRLTAGGQFTSAKAWQDGEEAAFGNKSVARLVRRLLRTDSRTFVKTFYARQGELAGLSHDTREYRAGRIADLLGLTRLDRVLAITRHEREACDVPHTTVPHPSNPADIESQATKAAERLRAARMEFEHLRATMDAQAGRAKRWRAIDAQAELLRKEYAVTLERLKRLPRVEGDLGRRQAEATQDLIRIRARLQPASPGAPGPCPLCGRPLDRADLERLRRNRLALLKEASRLEDDLRALDRKQAIAEQRRRRESERASTETRLATLEAERTRLAFDPAAYEAIERRWRELAGVLEQAAAQEASLRAVLEQARRHSAEAARMREAQERANLHRVLEGLLRRFRADLVARFLPSLEREASELLSAATGGRYGRLFLDRDFTVRMDDGGRSFVLNRYSGGEQDVACVALRLGLSRLLASPDSLHFVVLDEAFGSQDRDRRRSLLEALRRLCPPFRQIFVVTHVEEIQELLPAVLRVGEGSEGCARVKT